MCPNLSTSATVIVFQIRRILLNTERLIKKKSLQENVEFREEGCYISCLKIGMLSQNRLLLSRSCGLLFRIGTRTAGLALLGVAAALKLLRLRLDLGACWILARNCSMGSLEKACAITVWNSRVTSNLICGLISSIILPELRLRDSLVVLARTGYLPSKRFLSSILRSPTLESMSVSTTDRLLLSGGPISTIRENPWPTASFRLAVKGPSPLMVTTKALPSAW